MNATNKKKARLRGRAGDLGRGEERVRNGRSCLGWRFAMSLWDAFIDDYERRRKNLLKQIELMEARVRHTEKSDLGRWITTTAESLKHAKADLGC